MVAALMVLVQDTGKPGRRAAIWGVVIFMIPIIGPAFYLIWETVRYHREHGRPEKGMVEKYAPEEVAQRREEARREEARRDEDRRGSRRGDDADAAAD
nr:MULTISPECIES: PLD nuclease N-terminal domain-containing protein [unclassified Nesterenkonia]